MLLLTVDRIPARAAIGVQSQPIFRGNEQVNDGAALPPWLRKLWAQLFAPSEDHTEAGRLRTWPSWICTSQLCWHRAQHRDAVLFHSRGEPVHSWCCGHKDNARSERQGDVDLSEGCRSPIRRRVLQDPVCVGDTSLHDRAIVLHFPERHGVRHDKTLAMFGCPTCIGIQENTLWARHREAAGTPIDPSSHGHRGPQFCYLEDYAISRQPRHDQIRVSIHDCRQGPQLARRPRRPVALNGLVRQVLTQGCDGQSHAPTCKTEGVPSAASWQDQCHWSRRLRWPCTPRRCRRAHDASSQIGSAHGFPVRACTT
mmetsp:Transcript_41543/g.120259  ORF Transcript_41543/g.120259 Transcript_41543/m.120259 type:complete len:312 (+) Transcript_41543:1160-2095(+)